MKTNKKEIKGFRKYIKNFLEFVRDNLEKKMGILFVIAIVISALSIKSLVASISNNECSGTCLDNFSLFPEYFENIKIILITIVAGFVPYIYATVVGFIGYTLNTTSIFAFLIKGYGYGKGILLGLVPYLLSLVSISIITALGMYICRVMTVKYRISNINNMNLLNFRIKFNEIIGNEKKEKELNDIKNKKIKKIESKKEKINWLQIANTVAVAAIIQFISTLIIYLVA